LPNLHVCAKFGWIENWRIRNLGGQEVVSKFISVLLLQAHLERSFVIGAATVLLVLQLPSGYSQSERVSSPSPDNSGQVNVKTFGAVGDGVTNDTAAFTAALKSVAEAGGGTCLVPKGTYLISASGISTGRHKPSVLSGVHLIGAGREVSILKVAGMPTYHLLPCEGDNWSVENLTFDMGDYTPSVGQAAIAGRGNNWRVANCAVVKSGRWGIAAFGGNNWSIEGNYIKRTVPGARPPTGAILVTAAAGVWSSHGRVINNVCEGVGITFTGSNGVVAGNRINRSGSGSGIFVQGLPSTHSATIRDNICSGGSSGFDAAQGGRWWSVNGFEVWAPDSVICNNIAHDNDGGGFAIGGQSSIVIGNKAYNNGRGRNGYAGFNARINATKGTSASHSIFIGNSSYDQDYGYKEQGSGLSDIKQIGNDYNRNRRGPTKSFSAGGQMPISPEMKSKLKALAEGSDLPDNARRAVHECLAR
jgi:parallel beta-helix repeat protein